MVRQRARKIASGIVLGVACAIVALHCAWPDVYTRDCAVEPLQSVMPNIRRAGDLFVSDGGKRELKVLAQKISLRPDEEYRITLVAAGVGGSDPIVLSVDLCGENYDSPDQEFQVKLDPGAGDRRIEHVFHSGPRTPPFASLRIFFDSPETITLKDIRIVRLNRDGRGITGVALLICILLFGLFLIDGLQALFVFGFLLLLSLSAIQGEFGVPRYAPLDENRNRLGKPAGNIFTSLFTEGVGYGKKYERYFNDNFGMRDFFIRLKNQIDYSLFRRSDEVVIGKGDWMEYRNLIENQEIRSERLTDREWNALCNDILLLDEELRKKGIRLILLPIQQKFSIYPEYLTSQVSRPAKTAFYRLIDFLDSKPGIPVIDARGVLLETKKRYPVFYKTDFHWNEIGAFAVARETANTIARLSGRPPVWTHDLRYHLQPEYPGGLNRSLAVFFPPKESSIQLERTWSTNGAFLKPTPPVRRALPRGPRPRRRAAPPDRGGGEFFYRLFFPEQRIL